MSFFPVSRKDEDIRLLCVAIEKNTSLTSIDLRMNDVSADFEDLETIEVSSAMHGNILSLLKQLLVVFMVYLNVFSLVQHTQTIGETSIHSRVPKHVCFALRLKQRARRC